MYPIPPSSVTTSQSLWKWVVQRPSTGHERFVFGYSVLLYRTQTRAFRTSTGVGRCVCLSPSLSISGSLLIFALLGVCGVGNPHPPLQGATPSSCSVHRLGCICLVHGKNWVPRWGLCAGRLQRRGLATGSASRVLVAGTPL